MTAGMATVNALAVRGLHAYYGESHVLQGVDLEVRRGEAIALVGRNGAGKTTTVAAVAGLIRPRAGAVLVDGTDLRGAPAHRIARAGVALVPQGRRIFADLSVRENLLLAPRPGALDIGVEDFRLERDGLDRSIDLFAVCDRPR